MISIEPAPMLEDKEKWSLVFHDFIAKCLTKDPRVRPTASDMLKHKFIEKSKYGASAMLPKIEKAKQVRAQLAQQAQAVAPNSPDGPESNEGYGGTVLAKPHNVGFQAETDAGGELGGEGDFGTVIFRGGDEMDKTVERTPFQNDLRSLSTPDYVESPSADAVVDKSAETRFTVEESKSDTRQTSFRTSEGKPRTNATPISQGKDGTGLSSSTLKNETVSKKAFALQDKLWSIYAAGNTVPIPFLRATDISPIALLSDNVLGNMQQSSNQTVAVEALQELFAGDGQLKKARRVQNEMPLPPSVYQRLTSSSTLMNLAQALAYHKMCYEEMPLQELQATQEQQTIQNLCDTLRTILRL